MFKKKPLAVVGETLSDNCINSLERLGFEVLLLPPYFRLGGAVSSHADMLMRPIDGRIFAFSEYAEKTSVFQVLEERGHTPFYTDELPFEKYPKDILLNCLVVGKRIFAKRAYLSKALAEYVTENGYELTDINQGYARCTACPISDNAIITADPSVKKAALSVGIDVLSISTGHVTLSGYDYGFIGGSCGIFNNNVYFAGNLLSHPNGKEIFDFCKDHGMAAISLSDEPLSDVGSIFFFT